MQQMGSRESINAFRVWNRVSSWNSRLRTPNFLTVILLGLDKAHSSDCHAYSSMLVGPRKVFMGGDDPNTFSRCVMVLES